MKYFLEAPGNKIDTMQESAEEKYSTNVLSKDNDLNDLGQQKTYNQLCLISAKTRKPRTSMLMTNEIKLVVSMRM